MPILMTYPYALIFELTEAGMQETKLEKTSHYKIMEQFFTDKDRMFHHLFESM